MGILEHRDPQQGNANKKQVSYITHIVYSSLFILFAIVYIKYTMTTMTENYQAIKYFLQFPYGMEKMKPSKSVR
jgi:TRAP-type C4-dicarboxylate transport system permease small subunit